MVKNIIFLSILNLVICRTIPPAEVPVLLNDDMGSDNSATIDDYPGINAADIETEVLSGNNGGSVSDSMGNNDGETIVDGGVVTESNSYISDGGSYSGSQRFKEAVLVPKRQRRILARYKVIIPVIIPQIRMRIPDRGSSYNSRYSGGYNNNYGSNGRVSQNPG